MHSDLQKNSELRMDSMGNVANSNTDNIVDITPTSNQVTAEVSKEMSRKAKKKKFSFGKLVSLILILVSLVFIGAGAFIGYNILALNNSTFGQGQNQDLFSQLGQLGSLLNPNYRVELEGEKDGRTNFLLIGKDATGPGLTDTIIIASYYHKEKKFVTVNIPRDFYVYDGFGSYKINSVYPFAEGRQAGSGERFLADFLGNEFGIKIHYWISTNFQGLREVVDALGGVTINVDKYLQDCNYPTDNYSGYIRPCPTFEVGEQKMNGARALIYARSRYSTSDFDRSRRQSIVIQAILEEAKRQNIFESASKIKAYLDIIGKNVRTSMRIDELSSMAVLLKDIDISNSFLRANWQTGNGFLCPGDSADGAYIIWYCGGAIAGRRNTSTARKTAQEFVQNMLVKAELDELFNSTVAFVGNQSSETDKAYNAFSETGFTQLKLNNVYNQIPRATATSVEKVTVYIPDGKIRALFEKLDPKPEIEFELQPALPSDRVVPNNLKDAQIIVWVAP